MSQRGLKRELSFMNMIAIASACVIGGWLVEAPYWFSLSGAGSGFIFIILAILLVPVGLAFAELTAMLPFASAVDVWTTNAFGPTAGWFAQWMMFLVQVVEPPMMAFIFLTAFDFFIPIPAHMTKVVAISIVVFWYILSNFEIKLTGVLATILFFSMVGLALVVAIAFYTHENWTLSNIRNYGGFFPRGFQGASIALAVLTLKFIGFELTPTLIEETKFPAQKMWMVVLSGLFIPALLYCFVVLAMGGLAPWDQIAKMTMPEPELVAMLGLPIIITIFAVIAGLMHAFTTLMSFWVSSARVLYGAAQLKQLPEIFMSVNRYGQPWFANLVVLFFSIFFCFFTGANWVQYIYAVSCVAAGAVYFISCLDLMKLRKTHPEWERPYRAPGGNVVFTIGLLISIWIVIGSIIELPIGGYIALSIYLVIGYMLHVLMKVLRRKYPEKYGELITLTPEDKDHFGAL